MSHHRHGERDGCGVWGGGWGWRRNEDGEVGREDGGEVDGGMEERWTGKGGDGKREGVGGDGFVG